jgi:hypothetical protein
MAALACSRRPAHADIPQKQEIRITRQTARMPHGISGMMVTKAYWALIPLAP